MTESRMLKRAMKLSKVNTDIAELRGRRLMLNKLLKLLNSEVTSIDKKMFRLEDSLNKLGNE